MKTFVLSLIFCSTIFAQQKAETEPWLVDPAYVKECVYSINVGHNPYEAFLRSLAGLAEKLKMSKSEIQIDAPVNVSAVPAYSFGKVNITYSGKSFHESLQKGDSLDFQSTVSFSVKLQFSDKIKKCFITTGTEVIDRASDETFQPSTHNSKTKSEQSLSYEFNHMTFSDLLSELEHEGVTIRFKTDGGVTYALATYPLSKAKQ